MAKVTKREAEHRIGRLSGIKEGDDKFVAAQKVIDTMREAGMAPSAIRKAEKMLADAKALRSYLKGTGRNTL